MISKGTWQIWSCYLYLVVFRPKTRVHAARSHSQHVKIKQPGRRPCVAKFVTPPVWECKEWEESESGLIEVAGWVIHWTFTLRDWRVSPVWESRVRFNLFFKGMLRKKVNVRQCLNIRFINYMIEFSYFNSGWPNITKQEDWKLTFFRSKNENLCVIIWNNQWWNKYNSLKYNFEVHCLSISMFCYCYTYIYLILLSTLQIQSIQCLLAANFTSLFYQQSEKSPIAIIGKNAEHRPQ